MASDFWLIAGLGNPGKKYEDTRHNMGFMTADVLAERWTVNFADHKGLAMLGKSVMNLDGRTVKFFLAKPLTYMNLSGESLRALTDFYKIDVETELLVIYDDISLDVGQLRIRKKGSAGGHNGIKSIISHLGTNVFPRIKVGVGEKPSGYDLADYVLGHFSKDDRAKMQEGYTRAMHAAEMLVAGDVEQAMNEYNKKAKQEA